MSEFRRLASILILFHVTAVAVATIPAPGEVNAIDPARRTDASDPIAVRLAPALDRAAVVVFAIQRTLHGVLRPVRRVTQLYAGGAVHQRWRMFANPPTDDRFIRLDYYVETSPEAGSLRVSSEVVLPVGPEESLRYFRGKAIRNALDTYLRKEYSHLGIALERGEQPDPRLFMELVPLVSYFAARYADRHLTPPARIVRTELWYGSAPIPPPGQRSSETALAERQKQLTAYEQRPPRTASRLVLKARGAVEQEAGIRWRLEHIE